MRADVRMHEMGLTESREKARALIMEGKVAVDGKTIAKPGTFVSEDAVFTIASDLLPFVSRGGLKLKKAIDAFSLELEGLIAADIGASTGGFTDCMLQHGAKKIYAIDVGYGQLDWRLRNDERVVVMERTNARFIEPAWFAEMLDFASIDVAFISIRLILPALIHCLRPGGSVVALIKPQFEAGKDEVKKRGVIKDANVHFAVCNTILEHASNIGFDICGFTFSPITGPKGNIEYLVLLKKSCNARGSFLLGDWSIVSETIAQSHKNFER